MRETQKMATEYGERLKTAMAHAKLTQKALVAKTGIAQSTISSAINRGNGSAETAAFAVACGVDPLWLATGEGEMLGYMELADRHDAWLDSMPKPVKDGDHLIVRGHPRATDTGWPFDKVERDQYMALPPESQALVQTQFQEAITKEITRLYLKQESPKKTSRAA